MVNLSPSFLQIRDRSLFKCLGAAKKCGGHVNYHVASRGGGGGSP